MKVRTFSTNFVLFSQKLGCVYTRLDPSGTGTKLVGISLAFIWDLADPFWISSPFWYQLVSLVKVIQFRAVRFRGGTVPV